MQNAAGARWRQDGQVPGDDNGPNGPVQPCAISGRAAQAPDRERPDGGDAGKIAVDWSTPTGQGSLHLAMVCFDVIAIRGDPEIAEANRGSTIKTQVWPRSSG